MNRNTPASRAPCAALQHLTIERLEPFARPWRSSQKLQTRSHTRVVSETADLDTLPETVPAVMREQFFQHPCQRDSMERITRLITTHAPEHPKDPASRTSVCTALISSPLPQAGARRQSRSLHGNDRAGEFRVPSLRPQHPESPARPNEHHQKWTQMPRLRHPCRFRSE